MQSRDRIRHARVWKWLPSSCRRCSCWRSAAAVSCRAPAPEAFAAGVVSMSVGFKPVIWNTSKIVYDAILLAASGVYLVTFLVIAPATAPPGTQVDEAIRTCALFGSLAFLMLTFILCIGPLARIDRRWLPLLYNRRHFGVLTCTIALIHASHVIGWYFASARQIPMSRSSRQIQASISCADFRSSFLAFSRSSSCVSWLRQAMISG